MEITKIIKKEDLLEKNVKYEKLKAISKIIKTHSNKIRNFYKNF